LSSDRPEEVTAFSLTPNHHIYMDMEKIQSEIAALKSQIQALQQERAALTNHHVESGENDSPLAIVEAYRRQARENVQLSAELKGIDDAMYFLEKQIQQKKAHLNRYLPMSIRISQQQEQLEEAKKIAQIHAERVNELALELAKEIKLLKTCADELSPMYWQVYYKPFITGFKTISVPFVRSDGEVWMIVNRIV
jgi:chromosome segregation ATPase